MSRRNRGKHRKKGNAKHLFYFHGEATGDGRLFFVSFCRKWLKLFSYCRYISPNSVIVCIFASQKRPEVRVANGCKSLIINNLKRKEMITNCCPAATALPTIPAETCAQNFGQIQKIIFQRIMNGSTKNSIADGTSAGNAGLLASWTALKTATDSTKIAVTPFIEAPADDGGDARTFGGGNDTLNGIEIIIGSNPVNFTCRLNGKKQDIIAELKKLMCESQANNLGVFLVNENGNIEGIKDGDSWYPIPVQKLFVGDKMHGNWDGPDYNNMSFSFVPGYSDKLDVLTLDASALAL